MPTQNTTIKLPAERIVQLKAIAAALDLPSVADAVGYLIRKEAERGTIPDAVPGFAIKHHRNKVSIAIEDGAPVLVAKEAARQIAEVLEGVLEGEPGVASLEHDFAVIRQGTGIRIRLPIGDGGKVVSRDLARDLARILKRFAA